MKQYENGTKNYNSQLQYQLHTCDRDDCRCVTVLQYLIFFFYLIPIHFKIVFFFNLKIFKIKITLVNSNIKS